MDNEERPPVVRDEMLRQMVIFVFGIAGTIATVIIMRWLHKPDARRELKMRIALKGMRLTQQQIDFWNRHHDQFVRLYRGEMA